MIDSAGLDTELARILHSTGRLDTASLQRHLQATRSGRAQGGITLARSLIGQGLLSESEAQRYLQHLAGKRPSGRIGPGSTLSAGPGDTSAAPMMSWPAGAAQDTHRGRVPAQLDSASGTGRVGPGSTLASGGPHGTAGATRAAPTGGFNAVSAWGPGGVVGKFRIVERLGQGSNGVVFLVEREGSGDRYALKTIAPHSGEETRERFAREGEAQLRAGFHPNVVRVLGTGEEQGRPYMVMEFVEGGDLEGRMKSGVLDVGEALRIAQGIATGLAHMHQAGVLHRDLKPANVLMDGDVPKLVDFGLARLEDGRRSLTATGDIIGTPIFMSPEQAIGHRHLFGPKTDVYAVGVILYYLVSGRPPFMGTTTIDVLRQVIEDDPPALSYLRPEAPRALAELCQRMMAKEIDERPTAAELVAELEDVQEEVRAIEAGEVAAPKPRPPLVPLIAGAAILVLAVAVGLIAALSGGDDAALAGRERAAPERAQAEQARAEQARAEQARSRGAPEPTGPVAWDLPEGQSLRYRLKVASRFKVGGHEIRSRRTLVLRVERGDPDEGWEDSEEDEEDEDEKDEDEEDEDEEDEDWGDEETLHLQLTLEQLRVYAKGSGPRSKDVMKFMNGFAAEFDSDQEGESPFRDALGKSFTLDMDRTTGEVLEVFDVSALQKAIFETAPMADPMANMGGYPDVPRMGFTLPELDPAYLRNTLNAVLDVLPAEDDAADSPDGWRRDRSFLLATLYLPPVVARNLDMPVLRPKHTRPEARAVDWSGYLKVAPTRRNLEGHRKQTGRARYAGSHVLEASCVEEFGGKIIEPRKFRQGPGLMGGQRRPMNVRDMPRVPFEGKVEVELKLLDE